MLPLSQKAAFLRSLGMKLMLSRRLRSRENHAGCLCRAFSVGYLRLLAAPAVCGNGIYAVSFPAYDETLPPVFLSTILLCTVPFSRFRITRALTLSVVRRANTR